MSRHQRPLEALDGVLVEDPELTPVGPPDSVDGLGPEGHDEQMTPYVA
ncbi:MAG: hypothetical protein ACRDZR_07275 [Acidimicrobiales bacterium]